uniref:Uncharacterized protein n=1 Tax=Glossina pallidipes TaxID=7398 RepID=A0A1B0AJJ9_GLOPL
MIARCEWGHLFSSCLTDHISSVNSTESVITVSETVKYVGKLIVVEKCDQVYFPRRQAMEDCCQSLGSYELARFNLADILGKKGIAVLISRKYIEFCFLENILDLKTPEEKGEPVGYVNCAFHI